MVSGFDNVNSHLNYSNSSIVKLRLHGSSLNKNKKTDIVCFRSHFRMKKMSHFIYRFTIPMESSIKFIFFYHARNYDFLFFQLL